jgi:hypothetical protein
MNYLNECWRRKYRRLENNRNSKMAATVRFKEERKLIAQHLLSGAI